MRFPSHEKPTRTDRVRFADNTTSDYKPPINTMDLRYVACTDHHPACDCREADLREDIVEARSELDGLRKTLTEVLGGHPIETCCCTGCEIARRAHLTFLVDGI